MRTILLGFAVVLLLVAACDRGDEDAGNAYVFGPHGGRVLPPEAGRYSGEAVRYFEHGREVCRDAVPRVRVQGNQIFISVPYKVVFPEVPRRYRDAAFAGCSTEMAAQDTRSRRGGWGQDPASP